jgi:2-polyprenyl-3-methyl-5-hydroxy-6-metoxy-1,4-benzoquinol methylase
MDGRRNRYRLFTVVPKNRGLTPHIPATLLRLMTRRIKPRRSSTATTTGWRAGQQECAEDGAPGFPRNMRGMRALDLGCSDGFFSFEMEKRGADVVAVDFVPEDYTGFSVARRILGSSVEYRMDNVYNLSPEVYGYFDIVLFMGVLYHLRNPLGGLDAIRSVINDEGQLFVGTMMIDDYVQLPDGTRRDQYTRLRVRSPCGTARKTSDESPGGSSGAEAV